MNPTLTTRRIPELDGLRGVAIGMVVIWHYFVTSTIAQPATPLFYARALGRLTWTGVDLFFVLSGRYRSRLDRHGGWVEVSDGSGRTGWMLDSQAEVLPEI